ncbi:hypothetical protein GOP47_0015568 [Adiantum capillus-veneris]|uniref:Uncharacterized protein n=1 Tax=Adiantum capillus-veneris TaxID=13818 RepID=A0A9D4UKP6_ADICA|nr:hypothetical protein GOP47_0015568 [Adiantum capillus-veneris]
MGGGRRKVKTTKKSIQARQHQFFEQRRQQFRSQAVQEPNSDKFSRQQEHIYSLDIASLKNLSQLAQLNANNQPEGSKSLSFVPHKPEEVKRSTVCVDESKKILCLEEDVGINEIGSQPANVLDTAAHVMATVGTQWTPASAAAATALSHHEAIAPQGICENLAKNLHFETEELNREKKASKIKASPKQEKKIRIDHMQKRPSRPQRFEEFQILDLINDSHDNAQRKKDTRSENYAAYVLEGIGNVPNHTLKIEKVGEKESRYNEAIPACNSKHGNFRMQKPPQALTKQRSKEGRCKVQLQRHSVSTMDDESEAVTDLESFSDSNGEHCSGECKMRTHGSFKNQYSREALNIWDRSHSVNSNVDLSSSWAYFKEQGFLGSDFTMRTYQNPFESPKSVDFVLGEVIFPIGSNHRSGDANVEMDDDMLSDNNLRNFHSSLSSDDGTQGLQFGCFTDDKLLMVDSSSPTSSPQQRLEKTPCEFSFNSPAAELFSESTFEFQVTILDRSILEKDLESPALWERALDATQEDSNMVTYVDMSPAQSQHHDEFQFFELPKHDSAEFCAVGNLTAGETESSSVDTVFGTSILDLASSPTSPLFSQSHHLKLAFGRNLR